MMTFVLLAGNSVPALMPHAHAMALEPTRQFDVREHVSVRIFALRNSFQWNTSHGMRDALSLGFRDVEQVAAVDMRSWSGKGLLNAGIITKHAYLTMQNGKKFYHEVESGGAIGVTLSHLDACSEDTPTLVLEADARLSTHARARTQD